MTVIIVPKASSPQSELEAETQHDKHLQRTQTSQQPGMQTFATGLNGTPKGRIPPVDQQFGERRSSPQPAAHHQYGSNSMPALGKAINDQFTKERESRLKGMLKWGTVPALVAGFFSGGLLAPVAGLITGGYGWHRRVERNRKVFRKILSKYDQLYPQLKTLSDKQIDKAISDGEKFWNNQKNFVPEQSWKQRIQSKLGLGSSQQPQAQELRGESDVQADLTTTATNPGNEVSTMDKFKNYFSRLGNAVINRDPNNPGTAPVPQNP
ncbi:hypothetical protein H4R35_001418 [Dimargaris xerosporica]|nr:hypothetical protein H4R35_001418 [Dimargaris xerosporica]